MKTLEKPVPPGGIIGIIGGGQLGRMLALAAARLGLKALVYNDEPDAPAFQVTPLPCISCRASSSVRPDRLRISQFARVVVPRCHQPRP